MTVCGFSISSGGAYVWADVESYDKTGAPDRGEARKLGISERRLIGVACGDKTVGEHFASAVEWAPRLSFRDNVSWLLADLIEMTTRRRAAISRAGEGWDVRSTVAVVGFDAGRFCGLVMREYDGFEPREADAWGAPHFNTAPRCADDVFATAIEQMCVLRKSVPLATGRALEVAKVGERGVVRVRVPLSEADFG